MSTDLQELLEKASEALRRDITHIFLEVSSKKLKPSSARDLNAYIKTLVELSKIDDAGKKKLAKMPNEEIEKLARQALSGQHE